MLAILLLQAAGPFLPTPHPPSTGDKPCPITQPGDDIVVCARRNDDAFRLKPLPDRYARGLPPAALLLPGGVRAAGEVEGAGVGGVQSNRLMLRLTKPF